MGDIIGAGLIGAAVWHMVRGGDQTTPRAIDRTLRRREDAGVTVRLQAQGGGLEQSVVINSGAEGVVNASDALHGLGQLQSSLSPREAAARAVQFAKAQRYIQNAAAGGGVGFSKKSFAVPGSDVRVDVEVLRGRGLTPGGRSDAIISP